MQRLEASCAVRSIYTSLGAKRLNLVFICVVTSLIFKNRDGVYVTVLRGAFT